jgi:putative glutamine amidotransferase
VQIELTLSNSEAAQLMKSCDAVLLPGSPADVDPQKYGAEREAETASADVTRDNVDELLLQDAHNMRKPLLGICYGLQSLNVWRTGTLVQHIVSEVQHTRRRGDDRSKQIMHATEVESASLLGRIVASSGEEAGGVHVTLQVNSSHHQAVGVAGDGLKVVARSPQDGVIEALEGTDGDHWVLGVQWHPERMVGGDAAARAIFAELVRQAREWHERAQVAGRDFETAGNGRVNAQ